MGGGGGTSGSGRFFPPAPVLAARADNDDDKDGRIIVEETREKTRRGWQQGNRLVNHGHFRQYVHRCGLGATMTVLAPAATMRE